MASCNDIVGRGLEAKGRARATVTRRLRTVRAIELAIGERTDGPVFLAPDGRRLDRHAAGRTVRLSRRPD
jgi:hypothetical protein